MTDGLAFRKDVEFLAECNPPLVERNAREFRRLRDLLVEAGGPARRAETGTEWHSAHSGAYTGRLTETRKLVGHLAEGFDKAASALYAYALALAAAKAHYSDGLDAERKLAALIATKGTAVTRTAQQAEPMRQWEDMRATTGFLDGLAELTMDVDDIREQADRLHDTAGGFFHRAKTTESEARAVCTHSLRQAYDLLPEFKVTGAGERPDLPSAMADLRREAAEARTNPLTRLPGGGPKTGLTGPVGTDTLVSPRLADIRTRVAGLPEAADTFWLPPSGDGEKAEWIARNREVLRAAAQHAGLPDELVAGIAWKEIAGSPGLVDNGVDFFRRSADAPWGLSPVTARNLPGRLGGEVDETSFGPIAIQLRRGAEVLGYDPEHMTEQQQRVVQQALQDPKQNAFVAAGFLAQIKAETGLADVPADRLSPDQMQEIAARYNGGPYWESKKAQDYGDDFRDNLGKVREAMR
ncbi:hypothetical protein DEJ50_18855 [Streptomyces venezuelae]|uniref:Uncharacterized protein n=1 Tax=Streptomyces venezuelae TaxID=54571 RepID=A0A5P2DD59_STRVZ|nr:hypothetical protein DEJ50_18855 [Streptomyces venezuelae]